jgi:hypothetical protein
MSRTRAIRVDMFPLKLSKFLPNLRIGRKFDIKFAKERRIHNFLCGTLALIA